MSPEFSAQTNTDIVRINELARELMVKAKAIIDLLPEVGLTEKKTHSSSIPLEIAEKVRQHFHSIAEAGATAEEAATAAQMKTVASRAPATRPAAPLPASAGVAPPNPAVPARPITPPAAAAKPVAPAKLAPPASSPLAPAAPALTKPARTPATAVAQPSAARPSAAPGALADTSPRSEIQSRRAEPVVLKLPRKFAFHRRGFVDFDSVLACFDWSLRDVAVLLDITTCESTDYQMG